MAASLPPGSLQVSALANVALARAPPRRAPPDRRSLCGRPRGCDHLTSDEESGEGDAAAGDGAGDDDSSAYDDYYRGAFGGGAGLGNSARHDGTAAASECASLHPPPPEAAPPWRAAVSEGEWCHVPVTLGAAGAVWKGEQLAAFERHRRQLRFRRTLCSGDSKHLPVLLLACCLCLLSNSRSAQPLPL